MMNPQCAGQSNRRGQLACSHAFTLVELMIAIALMLLLMGGINLIFTMTGKAVGAGQALSDGIRNAQAAQSVMYRDLNNAVVNDAPCILLRSRTQPAFRNEADMLGDHDVSQAAPTPAQILSIDLNGNNTEGPPDTTPGEQILPCDVNYRNHRVDIFSLFVRDLFPRQTGNDGVIAANQTSNEAWIWYGHLSTPGTPTAHSPGSGNRGSNPDNYYATQWMVGRVAMLMAQPNPDTTIRDRNNVSQAYMKRSSSTSGTDVTPFDFLNTRDSVTNAKKLPDSRYDLAGISISQFRDALNDYIQFPGNLNPGPSAALSAGQWWRYMMLDDTVGDSRFRHSAVLVRPVTSVSAAQHAFEFLPACTQFIVEYAGDFLDQRPNDGAVINHYWPATVGGPANTTDGKIDFYVDPTNQQRKIRWYGFPRDTSSQSTSIAGHGGPDGRIIANDGDVIPLRDVSGDPVGAPFERILPAHGPDNIPAAGVGTDYRTLMTNPTIPFAYTCAWGPSDRKPSMIRITIVLDDAGARLTEGQTFEYVFKLQ